MFRTFSRSRLLPLTTNTCFRRVFRAAKTHVREVGLSTKAYTERVFFSKAEDDLIIKLRKEGRKWPEIAVALGRKKGSVYKRYLNYLSYRQDCAGKKLASMTPSQEARNQQILRWVENDGITFSEVARRLGLSTYCVRRYYDTVCPAWKRSTGYDNVPYSDLEIEAIASGLRLKKSFIEIAETLPGFKRSSQAVQVMALKSEYLRSLMTIKRRVFTSKEDDTIKALKGSMSLAQIGRHLGRSTSALHHRWKWLQRKDRETSAEDDPAAAGGHALHLSNGNGSFDHLPVNGCPSPTRAETDMRSTLVSRAIASTRWPRKANSDH